MHMTEALAQELAPEVRVNAIAPGVVLMPEGTDAAEVLKVAIDRKVAFVPGASFHPNGGGANTMRINFSYSNPDTIREGITRMGNVLKELLHKNGNGHK